MGPASKHEVFLLVTSLTTIPLVIVTGLAAVRTVQPASATNSAPAIFPADTVLVTKEELCFARDRGKWQERKWHTAGAALDSKAGRVTATLPEDTTVYYFNLTDERDCVISSEHEELPRS